MKIILLLPLLWSAIAGETNSSCMDLEESKAQLVYTTTEKSCKIEAQLMIFCINETNFKSDSNITLKSVNCTSHNTSATNISTMSTQPSAEMTTHPILCKCQEAGSVASIGLGALVGLLVVLLALVTIGWIWTCWTIKRRARITTNSSDNTNSNVNLSSNPSYRAGYQQTLQDHQLPTPIPTYETIPALTNTMDGIKLDLAEREGDVTDDSNNREDTYHKLNRAQRDDKMRENRDQSHRSGEKQGAKGKERVTGSSSGTGLLEIEQSYATTSTECLLPNSAVSSEEERSVSIGERSLEKDTENSSAKKNNKELDGTALEHNGYHGPAENVENKQDLPRKRATPRDYEQAVPSKN